MPLQSEESHNYVIISLAVSTIFKISYGMFVISTQFASEPALDMGDAD